MILICKGEDGGFRAVVFDPLGRLYAVNPKPGFTGKVGGGTFGELRFQPRPLSTDRSIAKLTIRTINFRYLRSILTFKKNKKQEEAGC